MKASTHSAEWPGLADERRAALWPRRRLPSSALRPVPPDKHQLRTLLLDRLKTQKEEHRRRKSAAIHRKLCRLGIFKRAKTVCCYVSLSYEVETWRLIARMLKAGKRVVVPRVRKTRLQLCELRDPATELASGAFGVLEPTARTVRTVRPAALDMVLVPGLAFDRRGHRLGHGRGYFDRFLKRVPVRTATIGLCFDFQLLDRLPTRPHDQAVQQVIAA